MRIVESRRVGLISPYAWAADAAPNTDITAEVACRARLITLLVESETLTMLFSEDMRMPATVGGLTVLLNEKATKEKTKRTAKGRRKEDIAIIGNLR